jgi:hypothetical protein
VIDAVDAAFRKHLADRIIDGARRFEVLAQGFFDHHPAFWRDQPVLAELLTDRTEEIGGGGEIEDANAVLSRLQRFGQAIPAFVLGGIERHIGKALEKGIDFTFVAFLLRDMSLERLPGEGLVIGIAHRAPRYGEDAGALRDLSGLVTVIEGWQNLALGQIARRAKHGKVENLDWNDTCCHIFVQCNMSELL